MMNVNLSCMINRPLGDVWKHLVNADFASKWMTGVFDARLISKEPMGVGATFRKVQRFYGLRTEMSYQIVDFEPNKKLTYKTDSGFLSYQATITLEPVERGTAITYVGMGKLWSLFQLVSPIAALVAKKRFEHDFSSLKERLEAQVPS